RLGGLDMQIDPLSEWRQMYREALRIEREYFFDPRTREIDLLDAERSFQPYIERLTARADLNYILREILGRLRVGHLSVSGGDKRMERSEKVGLLGADFVIENGRYRFARIYNGEGWNPGKRVPFAEPGQKVHEGEYLLAIDGRELTAANDIYRVCEGLAGKSITLRIAADAAGSNARQVTVMPIFNDLVLRYWSWIEDNRRKVDELSGGRLGYIHLPNNDSDGQRNVNRYYLSQIDKQGLVVDARFNSGGAGGLGITHHLARQVSHLGAVPHRRD